MLAHPRPSDIPCYPIRVFRRREREEQDQMSVVDLRNLGCESPRINHEPHGVPRRLCGLLRQSVAQVKMVNDHVHGFDLIVQR